MEITTNKSTALPTPQTSIPANAPARRVTESNRVPMSLPTAKLAVPEVPGYFLYWHLGKNVPAAMRAGYAFVDSDELTIEQKGVANAADESGSSDMGTRISVLAGGTTEDGLQSERLYLMKLPSEWRAQDEAKMGEVNEGIAVALRAGLLGAEEDPDKNKRYMKAGQDLFYKKGRQSPGR